MIEIVNFVLMLLKSVVMVGAVAGYWLVLFYIFNLFFKGLDKIFK